MGKPTLVKINLTGMSADEQKSIIVLSEFVMQASDEMSWESVALIPVAKLISHARANLKELCHGDECWGIDIAMAWRNAMVDEIKLIDEELIKYNKDAH